MHIIRILSSLLLGAFATATISDCSSGASVLKLTELSLDPTTPVRGQPLDMTVKFDNPGAEIVDGSVTTSVTLNFIPFQPTVDALCANTQCPLVTGANDRSTRSTWPDTVSGSIVSKIEWTGVDGSQLLCIQIKAKVGTVPKLRGKSNYTQEDAVNIATMWWPTTVEESDMTADEPVATEDYPMRPVAKRCGLYDDKAVGQWFNLTLTPPSF